MRSKLFLSLALALVLAASNGPRAGATPENRIESVEDCDREYLEALETHKIGKLNELLATNFEKVTANGIIQSRNEFLNHLGDTSGANIHQKLLSRDSRKYGDRTFMVVDHLEMSAQKSADRSGFQCDLWLGNLYVKLGRWQLAFSQTTVPQSAPADCIL